LLRLIQPLPPLSPALLSPTQRMRQSINRLRERVAAMSKGRAGWRLRVQLPLGLRARARALSQRWVEGRRRLGVAVQKRREQLKRIRKRIAERSRKAAKGLRGMWRKYGWVGVGVYFSIYWTVLMSLYAAVSQGGITAEHLQWLLDYFHLDDKLDTHKLKKGADSWWGKFLFAWFLMKFTEPPRMLATIALTPLVARWLRLRQARRAGAALKTAASASGKQNGGRHK